MKNGTISRRGMLGAAAGATVAVPQIAHDMSPFALLSRQHDLMAAKMNAADYALTVPWSRNDEIAKLRKSIAALAEDGSDFDIARFTVMSANISSLRSVSHAARTLLLARAEQRSRRMEERGWLTMRLDDLLAGK